MSWSLKSALLLVVVGTALDASAPSLPGTLVSTGITLVAALVVIRLLLDPRG